MAENAGVPGLLALGGAADPYPFIDSASRALAEGLADDGVRLQLVRRLAELGLLQRARECAAALSPALRDAPGFAELSTALSRARRTGLVRWNSYARQFAANLAALRARYPWAADIEAAWATAQPRLELHVTQDGARQVFERTSPTDGVWRPHFGCHMPHPPAAEFAQQLRGRLCPPFVLAGAALGAHLPWLHTASHQTYLGWSPVIYLLEPSFVGLAVALHLADWRAALTDPRIRLCCGPRAGEEFAAAIESDPWQPPPTSAVDCGCWAPLEPPASTLVQQAVATVAKREADDRAAVAAVYADRDHSHWARRFAAARCGSQPPLRILGITTRHSTVVQYCMRDALAVLERLGCTTRLLIEPEAHSCLPPAIRWITLRDFTPDLILLINHARGGPFTLPVPGVPVLTWVQDRVPTIFTPRLGRQLGPLDFFMGMGAAELTATCGLPANRFYSCEMATSATLLGDVAPGGAERLSVPHADDEGAFACDVAFFTNFAGTPADFHAESRARTPDLLRPLFDALYEDLGTRLLQGRLDGGITCELVTQRHAARLGICLTPAALAAVAGEFTRPLADRLLRLETVTWAANWAARTGRRFHLYGKNWERHPSLAPHARGFLAHGPALGRAIRAAHINLHAGCNHAFHQRVLDGLAAGGFFLLRRHRADVVHEVRANAFRWLRETGRTPPVRFSWRDAPLPLGDQLRRYHDLLGCDPDAPIEVTAEHLREFIDPPANAPLKPAEFWPEFNRLIFASEAEFVAQVEYFLAPPDARRSISESMRARVLHEFGYERLFTRVLDWLARTLASEPAARATPPAALCAAPA